MLLFLIEFFCDYIQSLVNRFLRNEKEIFFPINLKYKKNFINCHVSKLSRKLASRVFKTRDQCRTRAFNLKFRIFLYTYVSIFHVEPHRTLVLDTRFFFLHSLLRSLCSSFSPYTSPTDSSNLSTGATTQTHEFIISWHQSKTQTQKSRSRHQSNNFLSLGLLISTPK